MSRAASRLWIVLLLVAALTGATGRPPQATAQAQAADKDVIPGQQGTVVGHIYQAPLLSTPPEPSAEQRARIQAILKKTPIPMPTPPIDLTGTVGTAPPTRPNRPVKGQAPGDFVFFRNEALGSGTGGLTSVVGEPSVGSNGSAIFLTGNWYASLSTDNGFTWSFVDPFTLFPATGDFAGGFCCDQRVAHAADDDLVLWYLQYIPTGTTANDVNGVRIAAAVGTAGLVNNTWCTLDFTPESFGLGRGKWLDFPHMQVSNNFVYATSNVFTTTDDTFTEAVMWRVPISNFLNNCQGGTFTYWVVDNGFALALSHNATTTMYAGSIETSTSVRIYTQNESDSLLSSTVVGGLNQTFFGTHSCPGPDGNNWCGRSDSRIQAAWVADGVIGFMWNSAQGTGRPQPFVRALRVSEATKTLIDQPDIWDTDFAWHYPAIAVNARGHIAGPVWSGSSTTAPFVTILIADDLATPPPPWDNFVAANGTNGGDNAWGDYLGAQAHDDFPNTWIASGYTLQGPPGAPGFPNSNVEVRFFWFGRERDDPGLPPPPACDGTVDEDFEGSFPPSGWTTGGDGSWSKAAGEGVGGSAAAKAPVSIGDDQSSFLEVTLTVDDGAVCFFRKVSSEKDFDFLKFFIDGVEKGRWSGELSFTQELFPVTAGTHTFRWEYVKDFSLSSGEDTAWIDDVDFPLPSAPPGTAAVFRITSDGDVFSDRAFFCGLSGGGGDLPSGPCFNAGQGADLAERIDVTEPVEPGDVVELDPHHPGKYRRTRGPFSPRVAGVIATSPGITLANKPEEQHLLQDSLAAYSLWIRVGPRPWLALMVPTSPIPKATAVRPREPRISLQALVDGTHGGKGYPSLGSLSRTQALQWGLAGLREAMRARSAVERALARLPGRPLLALMGRVYVKATTENGPIHPGDLLTTASKPGYAMRCSRPEECVGALVGKALTALEKGEGLIEVLLTR